MQKVSWFFRISAVATLALIIAVASLAGGFGTNALAATGTAAAGTAIATVGGKLPFELCKVPTPTPEPSPTKAPATKRATAAATGAATKAATSAATMAATTAATRAVTTAATMAATSVATKAATTAATMAATAVPPTVVPPTVVPPTATTLPKGLKPASALIVLRSSATFKRGGAACVEVFSTTAGGPADVAGIKKSDLILGFDKTAVKTAAEFYSLVDKKVSGDKVLITVQRGTDEIAFSVTLGLNQFANPAATGAATAASGAATKAATSAATKAATAAK